MGDGYVEVSKIRAILELCYFVVVCGSWLEGISGHHMAANNVQDILDDDTGAPAGPIW